MSELDTNFDNQLASLDMGGEKVEEVEEVEQVETVFKKKQSKNLLNLPNQQQPTKRKRWVGILIKTSLKPNR